MIERLVVNGCSYMETYAGGKGHIDLAKQLSIPAAETLAIGGSANSRILRTTLKDSYLTTKPTFYMLGMTFISRLEVPILNGADQFEGRWTNPQNQQFKKHWLPVWKDSDTTQFVNLKLKWEVESLDDRTEDLMYQMLSVIVNLKSRGHRVLMYQQADTTHHQHLSKPTLALLQSTPEIIEGFAWASIPYQHQHGVTPVIYKNDAPYVPPEMVHPKPGNHQIINKYLTNYIQEYKILE